MVPILLTIAEAAESLRMSEGWVKQKIRAGELRSGKFGRSRRILATDLEAFARKIVVTTSDLGRSPENSGLPEVSEKTVGVR